MVAKLSSVSTMVAASRATSVPDTPHGDADVGAAQRRRVVDPVAGHRDDVPLGAQRVGDAQLRLRRAAGEDRSPCPRRAAASSSRSVIASSSAPVITRRRRAAMPTRRAISAAVRPWSPVTTMEPDAGACGSCATASATSGRGGSNMATTPEQRQVPLGLLAPAGRRARAIGSSRRATASSAQPRGCLVGHDRRRGARGRRWSAPCRCRRRRPRSRVHRARISSGAPLACTPPVAVDVDPRSTSAAARGRSGTAAAGPRPGRRGRRRTPSVGGRAQQRDLGRVAGSPRGGRGRARRCCRRRSPAPACAAPASGAAGSGQRRPGRRPPPRSRIVVTRIRFSVSVPVLSVQITVVEPSVSTALSRLTTAPRRASSRTPTASASVIVGSRPSGTLATSRPMAKVNAAAQRQSRRRRRRAAGTPAPTVTATSGDQPGHPLDLALQRALVPPDPLGQRGDPAELGAHAGGEDQRARPRRRCSWCR